MLNTPNFCESCGCRSPASVKIPNPQQLRPVAWVLLAPSTKASLGTRFSTSSGTTESLQRCRGDPWVLIISASTNCVSTDGRTWEGKDLSAAEDCWWFTCPLGHLLSSGGQGKGRRTNKSHRAETSGLLPPGHNRVSTIAAWEHQKRTRLLGTWKTSNSLLSLCLHHKRCILCAGRLP